MTASEPDRSCGAPIEATIAELVDRYSVILFDSFGVLADSFGSYPGAVELIEELNRTGKPYYVLTNDASARCPKQGRGVSGAWGWTSRLKPSSRPVRCWSTTSVARGS